MKVIEPSFSFVRPSHPAEGIAALRFIEHMARISHRSEDAQTEDSWERFIRSVVIDHGDWSVVEHSSATVIFRVDRGVTHELVRHRLFSFTQESTRFVRYGGKQVAELEFIYPANATPGGRDAWEAGIRHSENRYFEMLDAGNRPQEARSVLPNALAATIAVTGNFRNWRHLLLMRTSKETHPDFRRVTVPLLAEFQRRIPVLFEDIVPESRQIENMRLPR